MVGIEEQNPDWTRRKGEESLPKLKEQPNVSLRGHEQMQMACHALQKEEWRRKLKEEETTRNLQILTCSRPLLLGTAVPETLRWPSAFGLGTTCWDLRP